MSAVDDLTASVRALPPDDYVAFRAWYFVHAGYAPGWDEPARPARPPSDYEAFDPEAYDDETAALEAVLHDHWTDDLRALKTEEQVLAQDAATAARAAREGPGAFTVFREVYEAEHPRPGSGAPPEEKAAWEWAHLDAYYERTERLEDLARHRIEKGAFIARHTDVHRHAAEYVEGLFGPLRGLPPPTGEPAVETWPPDDPEEDLRRFWEVSDPPDLEDTMRRRAASAAYARADDLFYGAEGWMMAMPHPAPEGWDPVYEAVSGAADAMRDAAEASRRPGRIAETLLQVRRALPLADEARLAVDGAYAEPWMSPAAHRHLTAMLLAARDALLDHYALVRSEYDALWDVARRVLGGEAGGPRPSAPAPSAAPASEAVAALSDRVRALAPADADVFRRWFFVHVGNHAGRARMADAHRPASAYEAFDPEAYDAEKEALERVTHDRWQADLRALKTEAQVLAQDAARATREAREGPGEYAVFREVYEAEHPRPGSDAPPEEQAAWEWAHLDAYYERMEHLELLARHRIERGAFIERHAESHRRSAEWARALFGPAEGRPPRPAREPEPWPPDDPEADLRRFWNVAEPDDLAETMRLRAESPAYARADDLFYGAFGWMMSLPMPRPEGFKGVYRTVRGAASEMRAAAEASRQPGHIARTLLRVRGALPLADEARLVLDGAYAEPWVTPAAHRRLTTMLTDARDALLDHYALVRGEYDAFWDVARRVLGSAPAEGGPGGVD